MPKLGPLERFAKNTCSCGVRVSFPGRGDRSAVVCGSERFYRCVKRACTEFLDGDQCSWRGLERSGVSAFLRFFNNANAQTPATAPNNPSSTDPHTGYPSPHSHTENSAPLTETLLSRLPYWEKKPSQQQNFTPVNAEQRGTNLLNSRGSIRETLSKQIQKTTIVGWQNARRGYVFPAGQLDHRNRPLAGLDRVAGLFADGYVAWVWLTTPRPSLDGAAPLALLARGEVERVAEAAQGDRQGDCA